MPIITITATNQGDVLSVQSDFNDTATYVEMLKQASDLGYITAQPFPVPKIALLVHQHDLPEYQDEKPWVAELVSPNNHGTHESLVWAYGDTEAQATEALQSKLLTMRGPNKPPGA